MDAIAQLGRSAYHALCVAFAAQHKDKLYAPDTDMLLEEARELLGISEKDDEAIRSQIENDPMIDSLRRGEMPAGGVRLPAAPAGGRSSMPPPGAQAGLGGAYEPSPFSAPSHQAGTLQKMASKKTRKDEVSTPLSQAAPGSTSALVGRSLKRLFPDLSPPWVPGTITQFNPQNGMHLIAYGPPLRKELWDKVEDFAPQNVQWIEAGAVAAVPVPASKTGGSSKTGGGGSKSASKAPTPKAPPAPKAPPPPPPPPAAAPVLLLLPGGPSAFTANGMSPGAAPYNDAWLRTTLPKSKAEDLVSMLTAVDGREAAVVREVVSMLDDPADVAEITRLLEQSQALGKREQQLRAELQELGVMG